MIAADKHTVKSRPDSISLVGFFLLEKKKKNKQKKKTLPKL